MEKRHIYVDSVLADEFEAASNDESKEKIVKAIIADKKSSIQDELDSLDEDAARFKGICLSYKNEMKKIYDEQSDKLYKLWEDTGDISVPFRKNMDKLRYEVGSANTEIAATKRELESLSSLMENINSHKLETMIGLIKQISNLDIKSSEMLAFMVDRFKQQDN